jgi:hypothetical protein
MQAVQAGQCGFCTHFGEHQQQRAQTLANIVANDEADLTVVDDCGHLKYATLHLRLTPISGGDGSEAAMAA